MTVKLLIIGVDFMTLFVTISPGLAERQLRRSFTHEEPKS